MVRWQKAALAGSLVAAVCVLGLARWNSNQRISRLAELAQETRLNGLQLAGRLTGGLEKHRIALQQVAAFFENSEQVAEEEFQRFASTTLGLSPLCLRISFIDASYRVRWTHPQVHMAALASYDVRTHPEGFATLLRARKTKTTALSQPLKLVGGMPGFVLTAPAFRGGEFFGAIVCSFQSETFFDSMILPEARERYVEEVFDGETRLFPAGDGPEAAAPVEPFIHDIQVAGSTWRVRVMPRAGVVEDRIGSGEAAFWVMGCLLAAGAGFLTGVAAYRTMGLRVRLRDKESVLQQTRERLDQATEKLIQAEKLSALGELVAGVAHEINNPLAGILGYAQLMMRMDRSPEDRNRVRRICAEAERVGRIVRNLLTFARKHPPEKKFTSLNEVIIKTIELKAYHLRVNQIHVETDLAADLPKTMLDPHQIQQVILNLINNAEQAMLEAGKGGTIRVSTRRVGARVEALVADSGPGVPAEVQTRIFEPFFTTKPEGKGTGLGLALSYGIAREHGGQIRLESRDEGATFVLEIPVLEETRSDGAAQVTAPLAPSPHLRVLAIDDETTILGFLAELLSRAGHRVETASDVTQALSKIRSHRYDLIISDMKMPGGTGRDIYEAIVLRAPELARRVVFTTGDGANRDTIAFVRENGCQMLLKPYELEQLESVIAMAAQSTRPS